MPNEATSEQFNIEFAEISSRIRKSMEAVVPPNWLSAELVVREADPESDQFLEIDTPLYNPDTDELLGNLPTEMLDAIEELYLLFFPYQRTWKICVITLSPTSRGNRAFRTRFFYEQ